MAAFRSRCAASSSVGGPDGGGPPRWAKLVEQATPAALVVAGVSVAALTLSTINEGLHVVKTDVKVMGVHMEGLRADAKRIEAKMDSFEAKVDSKFGAIQEAIRQSLKR